MATEAAKQAVLAYLTDDWQSRVISAPRSRGKTTRYRMAVIAAKHEWTLVEEREGTIPSSQSHAARFADLAPTFKSLAHLDPEDCLKRVAEALAKITGKKLVFAKTTKIGVELWVDMGRQIDEFYGVNYAVDDDVKAKLYGDSEEDEE